MEHKLVDGRSAPESGDSVRIRVLRDEGDTIAVDRPHRDHPLELSADDEIAIPDEPGTYEVRGTVSRVMLAESSGADFLFLDDHHVEKVHDELVELPREEDGPNWKEIDATDADVDVDLESVMQEDTVFEESEPRSRSTLGEAESLTDSLNELLLDKP
ncbi:hypothetical protein ELS19_17075 [Halogeometricum borinquense]|uniref:Uncharacterized protein n=1 Tax=Halogeometricum borinquense TaxID=60847 RepID=A0A482T8M9_9EURY|nr:hypothetical protein [Halogeometricum borinquense]RYJ08269.1 hypothetical protein ELS19_17075 [Halogeometricum borinquense]